MKATGILVYTIGFDLSTAECQGPDDALCDRSFARLLGLDRRRAPTSLPRYRDPDRLSQVDELTRAKPSRRTYPWLKAIAHALVGGNFDILLHKVGDPRQDEGQ